MAKAFWKGAISFGMVSIPVKMYVATLSHGTNFHLLHKKCLTRPKQVLHCEKDDEYFSIKDTVRGYEYGKGRYVVLDEGDFEKVPVRTKHVIDILSFASEDEIDPAYFDGSHYLEPEELAVKPYNLLREALRKAGRVGIAKVSFQRKEHLCCLKPRDNLLALHTMHYQDEVLATSEIDIPKVEVNAAELKTAGSLIDVMTAKFQPEQYRDEYQKALEKIIKDKVKGKETIEVTPEEAIKEIPDLMAALRASIKVASKETAGSRR